MIWHVKEIIVSFFSIHWYNLSSLAVGLDNDLFLLINAEKEQEYHLPRSISSSLNVNGGHDGYYGAAFIRELENLIKNFEYTFDLEGSQIFPNNDIKQEIVVVL